jgi:hypothetical protein
MPGEPRSATAAVRRLRIDLNESEESAPALGPALAVAATVGLFVLFGGGSLEPGPAEARLGLAAGESFAPLGLVGGYLDPGLWPGRVLLSQLWAWAEGATTAAAIRWPEAIAAATVALLLARRLGAALGARAGVLAALVLSGSLGLIDRSTTVGIEWVAGLGVVAALDRILSRGSDAVAGLWAALAFLAGGWPAAAMIALLIVVIGRPGKSLSPALLIPTLVAFAAWSAWLLTAAPPAAWGAALTLPLTQGMAWALPAGIVAAGLPWSPFAALAASRSVRAGWGVEGRALVIGWLQVAGVALLAGALIPGLAAAARLPALVGLAVASAAVLDRAWARDLPAVARRVFVAIALLLALAWAAVATPAGYYLAAAVPYYRTLAVVLVLLAMATAAAALLAARHGCSRRAVGIVAAVAIGLKLAHWGYYAPEWNYRQGQGPWGRAIGQWVPPGWPIHTLNVVGLPISASGDFDPSLRPNAPASPWPDDLLFATGHPIRPLELRDLRRLQAMPPDRPMFFLLAPSEFDFWSEPLGLVRVRTLEDERGGTRLVARTRGELRTFRPDEAE